MRGRRQLPPEMRLFCLPFAGGAASAYRGWADGLPERLEVSAVQLPGRGSRFREAPIRSLGELVPLLATALSPLLELPYALFGHSMGAVVAFELARELRRRGAPLPVRLVVSGHRGPRCPPREPPIAHLDDAAFVEELGRRYDGIPPEVLAEEELLKLLLPVLRADVQLLESYSYVVEPPLACPLSGLGGRDDRHVTLAELEAWGEETSAGVSVRTFDGGHFFLESARGALLETLAAELAPWLAAGRERA